MKNKILFTIAFLLIAISVSAQKNNFTKQDTLRGSITKERIWWDLTYYHLDIQVFPETKSIKGKNTVKYTVLKPYNVLQIDLQAPLKITRVEQMDRELKVVSEGNAHFIQLLRDQKVGDTNEIVIYYEGIPKEAINAPWDGGFSWKKDKNGNHFIATSCQGWAQVSGGQPKTICMTKLKAWILACVYLLT